MAREREAGARDERVVVAGAAGERGAQEPVGALVEAGVAGLARLAQVGVGETDAGGDGAGVGADGRLQAGDLVVGGLRGARGVDRARDRGGRGIGGAEREERAERGSEAEDDGEEAGAGHGTGSVGGGGPPGGGPPSTVDR